MGDRGIPKSAFIPANAMELLNRIDRQRQAIQDTLQEHYQIAQDCRDTLRCNTFVTTNPDTDDYFLIAVNLPPKPQEHGVFIYLHLADGKILVETNNVGDFIEDLIDRGIPETDFVLP